MAEETSVLSARVEILHATQMNAPVTESGVTVTEDGKTVFVVTPAATGGLDGRIFLHDRTPAFDGAVLVKDADSPLLDGELELFNGPYEWAHWMPSLYSYNLLGVVPSTFRSQQGTLGSTDTGLCLVYSNDNDDLRARMKEFSGNEFTSYSREAILIPWDGTAYDWRRSVSLPLGSSKFLSFYTDRNKVYGTVVDYSGRPVTYGSLVELWTASAGSVTGLSAALISDSLALVIFIDSDGTNPGTLMGGLASVSGTTVSGTSATTLSPSGTVLEKNTIATLVTAFTASTGLVFVAWANLSGTTYTIKYLVIQVKGSASFQAGDVGTVDAAAGWDVCAAIIRDTFEGEDKVRLLFAAKGFYLLDVTWNASGVPSYVTTLSSSNALQPAMTGVPYSKIAVLYVGEGLCCVAGVYNFWLYIFFAREVDGALNFWRQVNSFASVDETVLGVGLTLVDENRIGVLFTSKTTWSSWYYNRVYLIAPCSWLLDGKVVVAQGMDFLDGQVVVGDEGTTSLDGKGRVAVSGTDSLDGLGQVTVYSTGLLDGLGKVKDSVAELLAGTTRLKNVPTGELDGTVQLYETTEALLDGAVRVKDSVSALLDLAVEVFDDRVSKFDGLFVLYDSGEPGAREELLALVALNEELHSFVALANSLLSSVCSEVELMTDVVKTISLYAPCLEGSVELETPVTREVYLTSDCSGKSVELITNIDTE